MTKTTDCSNDRVNTPSPETMAPLIMVDKIGKRYVKGREIVNALEQLSFTINPGEILGLLGPNGAGKTTAVKIIMGVVRPTTGRVLFDSRVLEPATPRPRFGYLPENFRPNPNFTVREYLRFHMRLAGSKENNPDDLLALVGMASFGKRKLADLSKGMNQRVGLAQAFAGDPDVLILDEPTSGLDPVGRHDVMSILNRMKSRGKAIFFCSHVLSEVEKLCDRIGILVSGRLHYHGTVPDFKDKWSVADMDEAFIKEVRCATL
jgi:ABC-2 type transport system ATP-binding protein